MRESDLIRLVRSEYARTQGLGGSACRQNVRNIFLWLLKVNRISAQNFCIDAKLNVRLIYARLANISNL